MSRFRLVTVDRAGYSMQWLQSGEAGVSGGVPLSSQSFLNQDVMIAQATVDMGLRLLVRVVDADAAGAYVFLANMKGAFNGAISGGFGSSYPIEVGMPDCEFFLEPDESLWAIASTTNCTVAVAESPWLPPRKCGC